MTHSQTATPVPTPTGRRRTSRARRWLQRALEPFWVVPALWCLGAVAGGLLLPELDESVSDWLPFVFQGGADGARTVLSTIAGAMISVTGLVFSITIVVLQLASSQFSPRVLQTFLSDRITQNTLGVFAASFLYSLTVLRSVEDNADSSVPQLGVTLAFLLVLAAVAMFLAFIHHVTQSISVATVIQQVGDETRTLLGRARETADARPTDPSPLPHLGRQTVVTADRSGYLDTIDPGLLCAAASEHGIRIELVRGRGTFVPEGAPLAVVHGDGDLASIDCSAVVHRGLGISRERTMTQDLSFGLRRLVDIAERALSPGTNDPTTATQAIDELHDVLRRLAGRHDPYPVWCDDEGTPRLITQEPTFADLLDLAVDEIAHWGRDGLQTTARLSAMLADLESAATGPHRAVVRAKADSIGLLS